MKNKSRVLSLFSLTLLLYVGMWVTSSCARLDKCKDSTKFGKIILVPFAGTNLSIGCENTRLCPSNRFVDECMNNDFRTNGENIIFPASGFYNVEITINATCDDGKPYEKTFKLPHSDVTVGLANPGLAYTVKNIPVDRNLVVTFILVEPCARHTRVCSSSLNDCQALSYAAQYVALGEFLTNATNNSVHNFALPVQNPTVKCGCGA